LTDGSEYRPSIVGRVGQRSVAIDSGDAEQVQSRVIGREDDGEDVLRMRNQSIFAPACLKLDVELVGTDEEMPWPANAFERLLDTDIALRVGAYMKRRCKANSQRH
jgi:hypothetical protein